MATSLERPRFFEGQYIGSADLEAIIAYARTMGREHMLGGHSWGIAIGLDLIEKPAEGGGVDYFVLPGFAWDGYGRQLVLLEPRQVPAARFASLPTGNQPVWLRYDEAPFQGLRPGFETCSSGEAYSRIRESVELEIGAFGLSEREGGVEIGGIATPDARLAARLFETAAPTDSANSAPVLCDGDVPHQAFPPDSGRWLVPIGAASWEGGSAGKLKARTADELKSSRTLRRMAGAVAENLFAADGVIRLRDRYKAYDSGTSLDQICAPLTAQDLKNAADAQGKDTPRLVGKELVWVEGDLRVTGQARLFGTRLELRDGSGGESNVPLYARRAVNPHPPGGQDFQIVIGEKSSDGNRLVVGPTDADYGSIKERLALRSDGTFAFGNSIPASFSVTGLVTSQSDVSFVLAGAAGKVGKLAFRALANPGPGATLGPDLAQIAFDDDPAKKVLQVGASTDAKRLTYWNGAGDVCIGAPDPQARLDIRDVGGTKSLRINADAVQALAAGAPAALDLQATGGGVTVNSSLGASARVAITASGLVGIGTQFPACALHILQPMPTLRVASSGGGDARFELASGLAVSSLEHVFANGSVTLTNGGTTNMTWSNGKVGIGLGSGLPVTNLHVQGTQTGAAGVLSNHVALIENVGGSSSDVLALRIGGTADASTNFITFFDNSGAIGRIESSTTVAGTNPASAGAFLRLLSGGADFAECLPRRDAAMPIGAGRIVGVRGGRVSLDTEGVDALMITTDRAVVVGNAVGSVETSEMVAFVGQVFVAVDGPVESGDFILPSGRDDGTGRAVHPDRLTPADAAGVVGRAWGDLPGKGPGRVCVAVGVQGADALSALSAALVNQQRTIDALQERFAGAPPASGG